MKKGIKKQLENLKQKLENYINLNYLVIFSPIILSSLFIYDSQFPVWANSLFFALIITLIAAIINRKNFSSKKEVNVLSFLSIIAGVVAAIIFVIVDKQNIMFSLFGKGVSEWTGISILSLFVLAAYIFILNKKQTKLIFLVSLVAVFYTIVNFLLVNYAPKIANWTGYINIPMLSFGKLLNYPFIFSLVGLITSIKSIVIFKIFDKKGVSFSDIKNKYVKYLFCAISILILVNVILYTLRYVGAYYYIKAANSASNANIVEAKNNINKAIAVAPFDVYYLGRIELLNLDLQNVLNSTSTNKEELQKQYKNIVEYQITDAKKAVEYDNKNPKNYLALGLAYEKAMLLTGDESYKFAAENYEKARNLAEDKDAIDIIEAKLAFSAKKEEEALSYIDRALKYNASSAPALFISSQYYDSKNNLDAAVAYGEKTVVVSPAAQDARMHLGLLYLKAGKLTEAAQMFGAAYNLSNNTDNTALYYLAASYKLKGETENFNLVIAELEKNLGPNVKEIIELKNATVQK